MIHQYQALLHHENSPSGRFATGLIPPGELGMELLAAAASLPWPRCAGALGMGFCAGESDPLATEKKHGFLVGKII